MKRLLLSAALALLFTGSASTAETLRIGMASVVTSIDPHFYNATPNNIIGSQIFDGLTIRDPDGKLLPHLAVSWEMTDETTWHFKLREGVVFHDGKPLTAADAAFSLIRAKDVPNSPGGFRSYIGKVLEARALDDLTLEVKTDGSAPDLPADLATIMIISQEAAGKATTADFNAGPAAIGTGPFKFVEFRQDERIELARNDDYWGTKPEWDKATYQMIPSAGARTAAILSGDIDVIEQPNPLDLERLAAAPNVELFEKPGLRAIYVSVSHKDQNPYITAKDGKALETNPLTDLRVRQALSISIDRTMLTDRLMGKTAVANAQWLPEGVTTWSPNIKDIQPDPEAAKALLAEAGYSDGFKVTLHVPTDRYPNAPAVAQGIAQMWSRIGVEARVESLPWSTYSKEYRNYALAILGFGNGSNDARSILLNVVGSSENDPSFGSSNAGNYINPELDALTTQALGTIDDTERAELLTKAVEMTMADVAFIPLYNQKNVWALRKGLTMPPRQLERTFASEITKAK